MLCFLRCKSRSVLAKPLEHQCSCATISPRRGHEFAAELAAPRPVFEALVPPRCSLYGRNVLPRLIVARTIAVMHRIEDSELRLPCRIQDLQHMWNTVIRLGDSLDARPNLSTLGNEVVIRIDHQKCGDALLVCRGVHGVLRWLNCPELIA